MNVSPKEEKQGSQPLAGFTIEEANQMRKSITMDTLEGNKALHQSWWKDVSGGFFDTFKGIMEGIGMWLDLGFTYMRDGREAYYAKAEYKYQLDKTTPAIEKALHNPAYDEETQTSNKPRLDPAAYNSASQNMRSQFSNSAQGNQPNAPQPAPAPVPQTQPAPTGP